MNSQSATRLLATLFALVLSAAAAPLAAQRADSARAAAAPPPVARPIVARDTTAPAPKSPLSPARSFLYSLLVPGYSQWVLGRPTAGAVFLTAEAITLTMLRESAANLADARRFRGDSVIVRFVDPVTGQPGVVREASQGDSSLVRVRRAQVEDWIAALVATHLFSGLDAFVAAHLWDVPTQISARPRNGGAVLAARVSF
ncbi:MAG: hypothetical protein ACYC3Q_11060 [Gemmatimonadaceae bacterium]